MEMDKVRLLEFCPTFQSHKKSYEMCCMSNEGGCGLFNARETYFITQLRFRFELLTSEY